MGSVPPRRHTLRLVADPAGITEAVAILHAGGLVAFPTETVYGLGAHALDAHAVRGIFDAKRRPADDPLIVHLGEPAEIETVARPSRLARRLADRFWPGPMTLVLPKQPCVPPEVTAGLGTVAVRVPAHPVARALLAASALPLAAPSANLFGRPSPTRAQHVLDDLEGRIDAVLDGGPTAFGVESTIVDVSSEPPRLLRPGALAAEEVEEALGVRLVLPPSPGIGPMPAPGLGLVHYAPRTPLVLIVGESSAARNRLRSEVEAALAAGQRPGALLVEEDRDLVPPVTTVEIVGSWSEPTVSATHLFDAIRALDAANLDVLFARELADPSIGLGRTLSDRLRRAARQVVDTRD